MPPAHLRRRATGERDGAVHDLRPFGGEALLKAAEQLFVSRDPVERCVGCDLLALDSFGRVADTLWRHSYVNAGSDSARSAPLPGSPP